MFARRRAPAFLLAAVLGASVAYDLMRMPVQVSDSLGYLIEAQRTPSIAEQFRLTLRNRGYLRPLWTAQYKALVDVAEGRYYLVFRGFHAALLVAFFLVFTSALRVQARLDLAAAAFALTVLTGHHTFLGLVREAGPISHYLEIAVFSLFALRLARSRGAWWIDVAAALLLTIAVLTLDSGVLVWVVLASAWIAGFRGVSWRGLVATTAVLGIYFWFRFAFLDTGVPTLSERSTGFLLERLEPDELQRRFGSSPIWFYVYNIAAAAISVLFSEPRDGVFLAVRAWRDGDVLPRMYLAIGSSVVTTALILWSAISRRLAGKAIDDADRLYFVAVAVLAANAAVSFAYNKGEIVSVAGAFYAVAAFAAARDVLERVQPPRRLSAALGAALLMFALGTAWAARSAGVHHVLRLQAFKQRNDWADVSLAHHDPWSVDRRGAALVEQLRTKALSMKVPNPNLMPRWNDRWFGE